MKNSRFDIQEKFVLLKDEKNVEKIEAKIIELNSLYSDYENLELEFMPDQDAYQIRCYQEIELPDYFNFVGYLRGFANVTGIALNPNDSDWSFIVVPALSDPFEEYLMGCFKNQLRFKVNIPDSILDTETYAITIEQDKSNEVYHLDYSHWQKYLS